MVQMARFPRFPLGHFPTPLEPMDRLTAHLREIYPQVPNLWIKRDDCTGLATGGNKTRKLEFLVGEAMLPTGSFKGRGAAVGRLGPEVPQRGDRRPTLLAIDGNIPVGARS